MGTTRMLTSIRRSGRRQVSSRPNDSIPQHRRPTAVWSVEVGLPRPACRPTQTRSSRLTTMATSVAHGVEEVAGPTAQPYPIASNDDHDKWARQSGPATVSGRAVFSTPDRANDRLAARPDGANPIPAATNRLPVLRPGRPVCRCVTLTTPRPRAA
jgi:hypothetical protein